MLQPHGRDAPPKLTPREGGIFVDELPFSVVFDYSAAGVRRSIEDSLQRLGTNRLDVALVHDIDRWTHGDRYEERLAQVVREALPQLQLAKSAGVVRAIGIGVNEVEACLRLADQAAIDCFMLAGRHTLLERSGCDELFACCARRGISVIAAAPFNSGILATGATPDARYNYLPAPPDIVNRAGVVVGCRSEAEAREAAALFSQPIPLEFWTAVD